MLPDPSDPSIVTFMTVVGGFVGATIGSRRGGDLPEIHCKIEEWTYAFVFTRLVAYVAAVLGSMILG